MSKNPNIILMFVDDLGIGDLTCFNPDSKIHTQHIDHLASQGMCFDDCHASSALCTPSRYGLLTGRYNWRSRIKIGVLPGHAYPLIEEGRETLGTMLQKQGYKTACVGKWHLGMNWTTKNGYNLPSIYEDPNSDIEKAAKGIDFDAPIHDGPLTRGFDYFYGMPASLDQPPFVKIENDRILKKPDHWIGKKNLSRQNSDDIDQVEYGPAAPDFDPKKIVPEMDNKVLELVEQYAGQDEPFFIYYPTLAVHQPILPDDEFKDKSGIGPYGDLVLQVDNFVGRLTKLLEEKKIAEDTIVIFASDNGCSAVVDYPALAKLGHNPSYIYRGKKGDIWDGGHRIPFVIRWPGHIEAGSRCDQMICLTDMFATIAELVGFEYGDDAGEDSFSIQSLLKGDDQPVRDYVMHHSVCFYSLRKGEWKLEFCPGSGGMAAIFSKDPNNEFNSNPEGTPYQLYNMKEDVREQHNLYGQKPEIEKELRDIAIQCFNDGRSTPGSKQENHPAKWWPGIEWIH
ncbi:MAG: arylsulfatase [Eubacterium sp.]|nr:arylsulfatase [Eubacterium sp.]